MIEKFKYLICHYNPPYAIIPPRKIVYSLIRLKFYFKNQNDFNFVDYSNIFFNIIISLLKIPP